MIIDVPFYSFEEKTKELLIKYMIAKQTKNTTKNPFLQKISKVNKSI